MAIRDVTGRYRGASFGIVWSLISPFLMLIVYTLAFGYIFGSRWPGASGTTDYALLLFLGLIVFGILAECLNRAPSLVVGNVNLVKKVVFPLDILPWTVVASAMFHALTNCVVFMLLFAVMRGVPHPHVILLPLVILPMALVGYGAAALVAAASVYLRDVGQVIGVLSTALLFLSSAIVPVEALPEKFHALFRLNPLTFIIDQAREVAFWGRFPEWGALAAYTMAALFFAFVAHAAYHRMSRGFADVL